MHKSISHSKMKKFYTFTFLIVSIFTVQFSFTQSPYLIYIDSPFKYYCATEEPDPNWFMPDYDDSSWTQDTGNIGYGYDFPDVPIDEGTVSLYLRYKFNVDAVPDIKKVNLFANYDDGYIAYINGKEILRINIPDSLENPAYDDITDRSHERESPSFPVLGYFFDNTIMDTTMVQGENTLAVHVLNDTIGGSDLFYELKFYNATNQGYDLWSWKSRYKRRCIMDSSRFPLVVIETDEFGIPCCNRKRVKAFMGIIDNGEGKYNHPFDSFNVYEGDISIEIRGQSSIHFAKRSYRFETITPEGEDTGVVLLDMPVDDDWILFGPFHDKAQFRNKMVMDLGTRLGSYQPRSRYCELIYNGECHGLYRLSETIKQGDDRVDIAGLTETELYPPEVTGGYILRYDKQDPGQDYLQIVYPKKDRIKQKQADYIMSYLQECEAVFFSNNFRDPENGFRKYYSDSSLVDYVIINEITKNADAYLYSTYFYKDREDIDNRIKMGPLWDYDLAFGNSIFQEADRTYGWQFEYNTILNITRFLQDEDLTQFLEDRWYELRQGVLHTDSLFSYMDSIASYIEEPRIRNYYVWPVIDEYLFFPNYVSQSYEEEIDNIKGWLGARLEWIDDNIDDIYYPVDIYNSLPEFYSLGHVKFDLFPNPFSEALTIVISNSPPASLSIELTNLLGQVTRIEYGELAEGYSEISLENNTINNLPKGMYVMRLFLDNHLAGIQRIVKE
jgi:spore coat protein CotH